jgi:hypothetical protein
MAGIIKNLMSVTKVACAETLTTSGFEFDEEA